MMELLLVLLAILAIDLAALRGGADTRPRFHEEPTRSI